MILEATACIGLPMAALWMRSLGITRILSVITSASYAVREAQLAARRTYREVYAVSMERLEGK